MSAPPPVRTAHHGCGGCGLVHLVLCSLNFGLQMGRWMEVLAFFPGAATFDVVHAHSDGVVVGINHGAVSRVGKATVVLSPGAVTPLIFSTNLKTRSTWNNFMNVVDSQCAFMTNTYRNQQGVAVYYEINDVPL